MRTAHAIASGAFAMLAVVSMTACSPDAPADRAPSPSVVASVAPLAWLATMVEPDAKVTVLTPPGASPHTMELTPSQAAALGDADVVLLVGAGLESVGVLDALRSGRSDRVILRMDDALATNSEDAHDHNESSDEPHPLAIDPHLWLDPALMRSAAVRLGAALRGDPALALAEIDAVDAAYRERLAPFAGARIVGMHDAWSRLAERYGLEAPASILARSEIEATPGAIENAAAALRAGPAVIALEPQMDATLAERLSALSGAPLVRLDPVGGRDWAHMMRANLDQLVDGLSQAETQRVKP